MNLWHGLILALVCISKATGSGHGGRPLRPRVKSLSQRIPPVTDNRIQGHPDMARTKEAGIHDVVSQSTSSKVPLKGFSPAKLVKPKETPGLAIITGFSGEEFSYKIKAGVNFITLNRINDSGAEGDVAIQASVVQSPEGTRKIVQYISKTTTARSVVLRSTGKYLEPIAPGVPGYRVEDSVQDGDVIVAASLDVIAEAFSIDALRATLNPCYVAEKLYSFRRLPDAWIAVLIVLAREVMVPAPPSSFGSIHHPPRFVAKRLARDASLDKTRGPGPGGEAAANKVVSDNIVPSINVTPPRHQPIFIDLDG